MTWRMKGSPCCAGVMRSCLHTYRTKTNLTQHIIQPWGGGGISQVWGAISQVWGAINQLWGGHQPSMGGFINQLWGASAKYGGAISQVRGGPSGKYGGSSTNYGGAISQVWGGHQPTMGRGHQPSMGEGGVFSHQYVQEVKIQRITLATHTSCRL